MAYDFTRGKYLVGMIGYNDVLGPKLAAVCFADNIPHAEIRMLFHNRTDPNSVPTAVSGGFFQVQTSKIGRPTLTLFGESTSCKVKVNPEVDEKLVAQALGILDHLYKSEAL